MLTISNLYAGYTKDHPILKGINLTVGDGKVTGILGRNGSGKSTLAKAICGLVPFTEGDILLDGTQIASLPTHELAKLGIGFFQQGGRVFPNLTVSDNITFAAGSLNKIEYIERLNEIKGWFELLRKPDRLKLNASFLSGGEKHQLALAMVLIQKPKFLILDEPSAGLSPSNQKILYDSLIVMQQNTNLSILVIEQNVALAAEFCEATYILQNGYFNNTTLLNDKQKNLV